MQKSRTFAIILLTTIITYLSTVCQNNYNYFIRYPRCFWNIMGVDGAGLTHWRMSQAQPVNATIAQTTPAHRTLFVWRSPIILSMASIYSWADFIYTIIVMVKSFVNNLLLPSNATSTNLFAYVCFFKCSLKFPPLWRV